MKNAIIHIGYQKTASTSLQYNLFSKHSDIEYLCDPEGDDYFRKEVVKMMEMDSIRYDGAELKKKFQEVRDASSKTVVISNEGLSGTIGADSGVIAHRMKDAFAPCRLVIVIRNQLDSIKSYFNRNQRKTSLISPKHDHVDFEIWLKYNLLPQHINWMYLSKLYYFNNIEFYASLFGRENIQVLLFEELLENDKLFVSKLSKYMDIGEEEAYALMQQERKNQGLTVSDIKNAKSKLRRYASKVNLLNNYVLNFTGDKKAYEDFSWHGRDGEVADLYREGNRKLCETYNLPLEKYNYPL